MIVKKDGGKSMDKILEKMETAAEAEYEKILAKWGVFHSAHEGYF